MPTIEVNDQGIGIWNDLKDFNKADKVLISKDLGVKLWYYPHDVYQTRYDIEKLSKLFTIGIQFIFLLISFIMDFSNMKPHSQKSFNDKTKI